MRRALCCVVVAAVLPPAAASGKTSDPPPCPPGVPAAIKFAGLPARIPFGPGQSFSVAWAGTAWNYVGAINVTMKSDGRVFLRDSTRQLPELSISLELGDGPAAVSSSFVQEDGAADDPAPCLRSISQRVRGYRDFRIIDHCDYPSRRPRSIIIACGDGNYQLRKLRWRPWNGNVATGRGTAYANNCIPYCAAGHFVAYPVRLRAYRPRKMGDGDYTYTRLRIVYPGSRPPGNPGHEVRRAGEDADSFFWR